jgi:hypothetical protein
MYTDLAKGSVLRVGTRDIVPLQDSLAEVEPWTPDLTTLLKISSAWRNCFRRRRSGGRVPARPPFFSISYKDQIDLLTIKQEDNFDRLRPAEFFQPVSPGSGTTPRRGVGRSYQNRIKNLVRRPIPGATGGGDVRCSRPSWVTELAGRILPRSPAWGLALRGVFRGVRRARPIAPRAFTRSPHFSNERIP